MILVGANRVVVHKTNAGQLALVAYGLYIFEDTLVVGGYSEITDTVWFSNSLGAIWRFHRDFRKVKHPELSCHENRKV